MAYMALPVVRKWDDFSRCFFPLPLVMTHGILPLLPYHLRTLISISLLIFLQKILKYSTICLKIVTPWWWKQTCFPKFRNLSLVRKRIKWIWVVITYPHLCFWSLGGLRITPLTPYCLIEWVRKQYTPLILIHYNFSLINCHLFHFFSILTSY